MKVQVSNTNAPCWRDITVNSQVPAQLKSLEEMARNIRWVWDSNTIELFRSISPELWKSTNGNPVALLQRISYERLEEIAADKSMMRHINDVYDDFKKYMDVEKRKDVPSVAYFSMEYGLANVLKIYSGGLGVLAGRLSERSQ